MANIFNFVKDGVSYTYDAESRNPLSLEAIDDVVNKDDDTTGSGSISSGKLTEYKISVPQLIEAARNKEKIVPPEGVDGFSVIDASEISLVEEEKVTNGTWFFGKDSSPFIVTKLDVNVPTDYTHDTVDVGRDSDPIVVNFEGKGFVLLGYLNEGTLQGLCGFTTRLVNSNKTTAQVSSAGSVAGTVSLDRTAKTLTYTPNTSFQMGKVPITTIVM